MIKYIEVLINVPINSSFTYAINDKNIDIGFRVEVPFGKNNSRNVTGFVINVFDILPPNFNIPKENIKEVIKVLDSAPLFTKEQIDLAMWVAKYYICAPGEALANMLPSAKKESSSGFFSLTEEDFSYKKHNLSEEQKKAISDILNSKDNNLHYLYGSTGTGKTEVFLSVAEEILKQNKGIIYLVPEIGLTHQVIESVTKRFGDTVAILHSGLTPTKKLAQWNRILNGEAKIVIGARSAIFAPVPNLGLVIIDEEHDGSYKSDKTPRYHARQVAMYRCKKLNIPLVMGSATPSVESFYYMNTSVIKKHCLTKRLAGGTQPQIETINLTDYALDGCISPKLEQEIRKTLDEGRQIILFLNRRGFTHFFRCNSCGFELKCKNCSVPLTYHKNQKKLRCHYCGWQIPMPTSCPECNSLDISYSGFGTEFIENEVRQKFVNAKIQRVDTDTLTKKGEFEKCLQDFKDGKIDILLGTQMVAKGLNFPNLKLVGIISADTALHLPDFRANERAFSLIVQVAGRTGRFFPDGKVILQTYNPYRSAIAFAANNDINSFYNYELKEREMLDFPPFCRLIRLVFRSSKEKLSETAAINASEILSKPIDQYKELDYTILGPSECPLTKIAANYRWQIILKGYNLKTMQQAVSNLCWNYKSPFGVYMEIDVDPVNLL